MARSTPGKRMANNKLPSVAAALAQAAGAGVLHTAPGQAAKVFKPATKACNETAATSHAAGTNAPSKHRGVTHKVTQGMATALASKPTTDTC